MAYNPYYANSYYPPIPQMQNNFLNNGAMPDALSQMKTNYAPTNDMLWVLGEIEAQSYPVAPNNTVTLWDKNQPTIYIKSANVQGVPSIRILDFTERSSTPPKASTHHECTCGEKFVTKEDFNVLCNKYDEMKNIIDGLTAKSNKKIAKENDE